MDSVAEEAFGDLLVSFTREAIHLETCDACGTAVELPQWPGGPGEPDDLEWLHGWFASLRRHVEGGQSGRRARIVSEPLSNYQRWSYSVANPMVDAGKDIRWVPRRLLSSIALPGNDFYLFDDRLVVFLTYAGNGLAVNRLASTGAADIQLCRSPFGAVWQPPSPTVNTTRWLGGATLRDTP